MSFFLAWGDFHARSRFARSTIPEEKWGTTRSLVYCVIDYQTVMRSCYKPSKILSNAWWERTKVHSEIEALRARHEVPRRKRRLLSLLYVHCYSSAVITFGGFPEHWIIFYLRFIRRPNDRLLDSTVQKQRRCPY